MKPVVIHPTPKAELDASMAFYERRAAGLGLDLLAQVEAGIERIRATPAAWPPHRRSNFRKYLTQRFPFVIFYLDLPDGIWIAAIAHGSRQPDYWRHRRPPQSG